MKLSDIPILPTKIIVDTHEKRTVPGVYNKLVELKKSPEQVYPLPFADYYMWSRSGELVVVERKHNDLADAWPHKLHRQIIQKPLDNGIKNMVLLIEGIFPTSYSSGKLLAGEKVRGIWYDQVWSTLLGWQEKYGLRVYQCHEGPAHLVRALLSIQRHYRR